jgi:hypothetical protein
VGIRAYNYLLPWVVFVIVDRNSGLGVLWAASISLGCGVGVLALAAYRKEHVFCGLGFVLTFGSTLIAYSLLTSPAFHTLEPFARSVVSAGIGLVLLASLLVAPASKDHLRSLTVPPFWDTMEFERANMRVTARWGLTMLAIAAAYGAEAAISGGPIVRTACDWLIPLLACLICVHWDGRTAHVLSEPDLTGADGAPLGIAPVHSRTIHERQRESRAEGDIAVIRELRQGNRTFGQS